MVVVDANICIDSLENRIMGMKIGEEYSFLSTSIQVRIWEEDEWILCVGGEKAAFLWIFAGEVEIVCLYGMGWRWDVTIP